MKILQETSKLEFTGVVFVGAFVLMLALVIFTSLTLLQGFVYLGLLSILSEALINGVRDTIRLFKKD